MAEVTVNGSTPRISPTGPSTRQAPMPYSARRPLPADQPALRIDWPLTVRLAKMGASEGIRAWLAESEVRGGRVDGAVGRLTPGALRSRGLLRQSMWTAMVRGGASEFVAAGFADATSESWNAWFAGYEITLDYPALAAVEGASASPVGNKPTPLAKGQSAAHDRLEGEPLAATIERVLLPFSAIPGMHEACCEFAAWLSGCFARWHSMVVLTSILASGPVPSYAPPKVTCGPVVGGTLFSRRPLLTDFRLFDPAEG